MSDNPGPIPTAKFALSSATRVTAARSTTDSFPAAVILVLSVFEVIHWNTTQTAAVVGLCGYLTPLAHQLAERWSGRRLFGVKA